ncbi:hypothetical protein PHMEG_0008349 [Phytophthora megakarya]|uniref:Uncharacterized protein n=1 Tax=Phytophthora megakarya TaxID=4795 RepID=A0A225WLE4_9STRA|nr:hypothetical protein PHMEG_0008349 [Phytophthora megakarya]
MRVAFAGSLRAILRWIVATKKLESPKYFDGDTSKQFFLKSGKQSECARLMVFETQSKIRIDDRELLFLLPTKKNMSRNTGYENSIQCSTRIWKDPLPHSLCQKLCCNSLSRQDGGFVHLFLTTQWNLMCRSELVQTLSSEHLSAHDDSVGCTMHTTKTNQEGGGLKDPRHMYANPLSPTTGWVTALAIYLAYRPTQESGPLFPGSKQKSRFGTALRQLVGVQSGLNHYGAHSIRKGVATFACSGPTSGPSITSMCLRGSWSLGVQDHYIRYESAGDQYLGRVVAGLPLNRAKFSILPPHFSDNNGRDVRDVSKRCSLL